MTRREPQRQAAPGLIKKDELAVCTVWNLFNLKTSISI
jgi:hypothetical protein